MKLVVSEDGGWVGGGEAYAEDSRIKLTTHHNLPLPHLCSSLPTTLLLTSVSLRDIYNQNAGGGCTFQVRTKGGRLGNRRLTHEWGLVRVWSYFCISFGQSQFLNVVVLFRRLEFFQPLPHPAFSPPTPPPRPLFTPSSIFFLHPFHTDA